MLMLAQTTSAIIDGIEIEHGCYEQLKQIFHLHHGTIDYMR
jgi:hypothetical protein